MGIFLERDLSMFMQMWFVVKCTCTEKKNEEGERERRIEMVVFGSNSELSR